MVLNPGGKKPKNFLETLKAVKILPTTGTFEGVVYVMLLGDYPYVYRKAFILEASQNIGNAFYRRCSTAGYLSMSSDEVA